MSTVTTLLNLVKPTTAEQFSLATYNNNLDLIDAGYGKLPKKMAGGADTMSIGAGASSVTKVINLPAGFTAPPVVLLQNAANRGLRAALLILDAYSVTNTQFTIKMQTSDNAAIGTAFDINIYWLAVLL